MVLTVLIAINLQKNFEIGKLEFNFVVISGALLLIAVVSGAWLSIDKQLNNIILTIHKVTNILAVICSAATIYFITSWK